MGKIMSIIDFVNTFEEWFYMANYLALELQISDIILTKMLVKN
jgi:hypothetical protein